jgi:hypothetical protein
MPSPFGSPPTRRGWQDGDGGFSRHVFLGDGEDGEELASDQCRQLAAALLDTAAQNAAGGNRIELMRV